MGIPKIRFLKWIGGCQGQEGGGNREMLVKGYGFPVIGE